MKYVMMERDIGDGVIQLIPVLFPKDLIHEDMAKAITKMLPKAKAVAAGECHVRVISTHGRSETLQLDARVGDADVINVIDYSGIRCV